MAIAIDFGTSNTVISRWNAATKQAETVTLPGLSLVGGMNPPLIPSLVYVEDESKDRVLLGQMVRDRGLDLQSDNRYFRGFKRGIGAQIWVDPFFCLSEGKDSRENRDCCCS